MISSPCIKKCVVDMDVQICLGCGRTLREIEDWEDWSEECRKSTMRVLASRLEYLEYEKVTLNTIDLTRLLQP